jgi:hypothetical protein
VQAERSLDFVAARAAQPARRIAAKGALAIAASTADELTRALAFARETKTAHFATVTRLI